MVRRPTALLLPLLLLAGRCAALAAGGGGSSSRSRLRAARKRAASARPLWQGDSGARWTHKQLSDADADGGRTRRRGGSVGVIGGDGDGGSAAADAPPRAADPPPRTGGRGRSAKRSRFYAALRRYSSHFAELLRFEWESELAQYNEELKVWPRHRLRSEGRILEALVVRYKGLTLIRAVIYIYIYNGRPHIGTYCDSSVATCHT